MNPNQQFEYKLPFINTDLLRRELVNLEGKINGSDVKIVEKSGMRKDRYSSLAYNYWVQHELELRELRSDKGGFDIQKYAAQLSKLQHKPISY